MTEFEDISLGPPVFRDSGSSLLEALSSLGSCDTCLRFNLLPVCLLLASAPAGISSNSAFIFVFSHHARAFCLGHLFCGHGFFLHCVRITPASVTPAQTLVMELSFLVNDITKHLTQDRRLLGGCPEFASPTLAPPMPPS